MNLSVLLKGGGFLKKTKKTVIISNILRKRSLFEECLLSFSFEMRLMESEKNRPLAKSGLIAAEIYMKTISGSLKIKSNM